MNENLINQQGQSVGSRVYGGDTPEKQDEKPLTREEVQSVITDLVNTIKEGFATKNDLDSLVNRLSSSIANVQNRIPTRDAIINTAKLAVPVCLRNLDSGGSPRTGPVLQLAPAPVGTSGNADSCFFGEETGTKLPDGTVVFPHLQWNDTTKKWDIALITGTLPPGTASLPHLKWNASTSQWEIALIVPDGTPSSPHLIWSNGAWTIGTISGGGGLPDGGTTYQVLQRQGGVAVWDWTRWATVVT